MANSNRSENLMWFLAGAAVGAAVALLFAPKTGEELRALIGEKAGQGRDYLVETGRDVYAKGKELYEKGRGLAEEAADLVDRGRKAVHL
jgi:gas vesicle protein